MLIILLITEDLLDERLQKIIIEAMKEVYEDVRITTCSECLFQDFQNRWEDPDDNVHTDVDNSPWLMQDHYCWIYPMKYQEEVISSIFKRLSVRQLLKLWIHDFTTAHEFDKTCSIMNLHFKTIALRKTLYHSMLADMK
jgi:hypothetical protein